MKKVIILLILASIFNIANMSGNTITTTFTVPSDTIKMKFPYKEFLGTWVSCVAPHDTVTIKLEFRLIYSTTAKLYCESIMGAVKRVQNGKIILDEPIEDVTQEKNGTILQGTTTRNNLLYLVYGEKGKNKDIGSVAFTLQTDKKTANWKLKSIRECFFGEEYDPFLLPAKMTFVKK